MCSIPRRASGVGVGLLLVLLALGGAPAEAGEGRVAEMAVGKGAIKWAPAAEYERLVLVVSGPGVDRRREFAEGETPVLPIEEEKSGKLPDGSYSYELLVVPRMDPGAKERLAAARDARDRGLEVDIRELQPTGPSVQSGHFSILDGAFVQAGEDEPGRRTKQTGAVRIEGDLEAAGKKSFVAADPAAPDRELVYVALEGPEAGTYYRGSARTRGGEAVIELPEHFGAVTEPDGLTVQLTPAGAWSRLYVVEKSPARLVVRSADGGEIEFDYLVQGVRKGYSDFRVERPAEER